MRIDKSKQKCIYGNPCYQNNLDQIQKLKESIIDINRVRLPKENYYLQRAVQKILKVVKSLENE